MSFTVDELAARAGVIDINRECGEDDILSLASFCDPWQLVGRHLGLSEPQISAIDGDNRSTDLKRLGTLQKWKEKFVFKATYRVLVGALIDCGKAQQAMKVCEHLAQKEKSLGLTPPQPPKGAHSGQANASASVAVPPSSSSQDLPPRSTSSSSLPSSTPAVATSGTNPSSSAGGGSSSATPASAANPSSDEPPKLSKLLKLLMPVSTHWRNIGVLLELEDSSLGAIETSNRGVPDNCLREMLNQWLSQTNPRPTKTALVEAVETYNPVLAQKIAALREQ